MIQSGISNFMTPPGSRPRDIADGNLNLLDLIRSDSVLELVFGSGLLMFCYGVLLCCSAVSGGKFMFETLQYFWPCKKTNVEINMNRNTGISNATGNNRQLMAAEWRDLFNDPALWEQAPPPYYNHL